MHLGSSHYSPWLVEGAVRLGSQVTFAQAAAVLTHFTGVPMCASTVRRLTLAAGETVRHLDLAGTDALWTGALVVQPTASVPLQLSIDGSLVHVRDEGWREVKVLAIGARTADGLQALSYAATLGDAEQFGQEVLGEIVRREVSWAPDVVAVNDGASWIQGVLDLHCPQAQRVLDFAHAAAYLADAATASFGEETAATGAWFGQWRQELLDGEPATVLAALAALPASEARDRALGYLTARREQIAYRVFRDRGWPIGSGCVESAHQHVVQDRLKGRGMRWRRSGVEQVLALRVVAANGRWSAQWPQVIPQQRSTRRVQRRPARSVETAPSRSPVTPAPPSAPALSPRAPLMVNGRPTANHPWRRFHLPGSPPRHHES